MGKMKQMMIEIRNRGWPINNKSLKKLIKEKQDKELYLENQEDGQINIAKDENNIGPL